MSELAANLEPYSPFGLMSVYPNAVSFFARETENSRTSRSRVGSRGVGNLHAQAIVNNGDNHSNAVSTHEAGRGAGVTGQGQHIVEGFTAVNRRRITLVSLERHEASHLRSWQVNFGTLASPNAV